MGLEYLPIEKDLIPQQFAVSLWGTKFVFLVRYNSLGDFFTIDLSDANGNALVTGEKVMLNRPLFNEKADLLGSAGYLMPIDVSGSSDRITYDSFYNSVFIFLIDR